MAGLSRTMDLQRADVAVAMGFNTRLIELSARSQIALKLFWFDGTGSLDAAFARADVQSRRQVRRASAVSSATKCSVS